jgi:hypothetical protein
MFDPIGKLITELRADPAVAALTTRIRGGEPAPGDATTPFQRFVVLVRLGRMRHRRVPFQSQLIGINCYGTTFADAAVLSGAVSDALHAAGPRLTSAGLVYNTYEESGGDATKDPGTGQPFETIVVEVLATTAPVAAPA